MTYKTLSDFKAHNKATGRHFFDKDAKQFFNSRIESRLYKGKFFITSEQFSAEDGRFYSVRRANDDGSVTTISEFQQFATLQGAKDWIKELVE